MSITFNDNEKVNACFEFNKLVNNASFVNYFKKIVPGWYTTTAITAKTRSSQVHLYVWYQLSDCSINL